MANVFLDLDHSERKASWKFQLVDQAHNGLGYIDVDRFELPTLSVDTSRSIKRTITGVRVNPNVIDGIDVIHNRVRLIMVLEDDSEWPQGVFMFSDVSRFVVSKGMNIGHLGLVDQLLIVDQQLERSVSFGPGTQITYAIGTLLNELPITYEMTDAGDVISPSAEAISWPAGTSRLRVVNELAAMIGYHELFFANDGVGQLHAMPNPELADESVVMKYPEGLRTFFGTVTRSTNLLELPNRFVVVNNGVTDTPIFGIYDIPDDAPHSYANRGFFITYVEDQQGVADSTAAVKAARSLARKWKFPYETVEFAGPPDPRHDTYDVVEFEGERFLELAWSMQLRDGEPMRHSVRRTYEGD